MTAEEKAKAYDNIIEKATKMHNENCEACQMCIEELIPELSESKDDKIRGAIIYFISHTPTVPKGIIGKKTMIAWLEKQGNPNTEYWKGYKDGKKAILDKYSETHKVVGPKFKIGDIISNDKVVYRIDGITKNAIGQDCYFLVNIEDEEKGLRHLIDTDSEGKHHYFGETEWLCEQVDRQFWIKKD